jgi:hypothetical protein
MLWYTEQAVHRGRVDVLWIRPEIQAQREETKSDGEFFDDSSFDAAIYNLVVWTTPFRVNGWDRTRTRLR